MVVGNRVGSGRGPTIRKMSLIVSLSKSKTNGDYAVRRRFKGSDPCLLTLVSEP
jgi:hypothetical protein